jgi:hypothetical protein
MKLKILGTVLASSLLALSAQVLAQSPAERPADAATQPSQSTPDSKKDDAASMGSTTAPAKSGDTFTHGESKRCESLSGADKDQCDKEEATKTEGPAAQEASKPQDAPKGFSKY